MLLIIADGKLQLVEVLSWWGLHATLRMVVATSSGLGF